MQLTMMAATEGHRKLIADLAAESPILRKAQVMSVAWLTSADQAGLLGNKPHMLAIANATRLWMRQDGFVHR